jgi:hypothetical protein
MSGASIEATAIRLVADAGALWAFVSVRIGGMTVHGVRVIDTGRPFVALPQVPVRAKLDGSGAGWQSVVEASPSLMSRITAAVLAAWRERAP